MEIENSGTVIKQEPCILQPILEEKPINPVSSNKHTKSLKKRLEGPKRKHKKKQRVAKQMEVEKAEGKSFKVRLSEKFDSLASKSGASLATAITKILKETNKDLIFRIVECIGDDKARSFVKESLETWFQGGIKRKDCPESRTFGGIFIQLAKDHVDSNDPMKLKDVFKKSTASRSKRNIIKSRRRKARKQIAKNTGVIKTINKTDILNPSNNIFSSLAS